MNELSPILESSTATLIFTCGSVLAGLIFAVCVAWLRSERQGAQVQPLALLATSR